MKNGQLLIALGSVSLLFGCADTMERYEKREYTSISNPASVYCVQQGGELKTIDENAQRVTYCLLPEQERIEQWEYYRNNHQSNDTTY